MKQIETMRHSTGPGALALLWLFAVMTGCADGALSTGAPDGETACDECHGAPPAPPHPVATDCAACHAGTVLADGEIDAAGGLHANGVADIEYAGCDACHGAPPAAPHPEGDDCSVCHPGTVLADGAVDVAGGLHANGAVDADAPHPDGYTAPDAHGADFNAGGPAACTDCHGAELDGGSSGVSCETCHEAFRTNCTFCHGGTDNDTGAPPESLTGETATDSAGVGAHTAHLLADPTWHSAFDCSDCHKVPADALDDGHIDGEVLHVWGATATGDGAEPAFADGACSGVYCHGSTMEAGTVTSPSWTTVDGSQAACGACHGLPPTGAHPPMDDCSVCHGCVSDEDQAIRPEGAQFHIDGNVNMEGEGECPAE